MSVLRSRLSLVELQLLAECELACNPTITVYTMRDGVEHNRRPANPMARLLASLERITGKFEELGIAARKAGESIGETFSAAFGGER